MEKCSSQLDAPARLGRVLATPAAQPPERRRRKNAPLLVRSDPAWHPPPRPQARLPSPWLRPGPAWPTRIEPASGPCRRLGEKIPAARRTMARRVGRIAASNHPAQPANRYSRIFPWGKEEGQFYTGLIASSELRVVKQAINEVGNFFKMAIQGDQLRAGLHGQCGNPDVIGGKRGALLFQVGGDSGIPI